MGRARLRWVEIQHLQSELSRHAGLLVFMGQQDSRSETDAVALQLSWICRPHRNHVRG
jgi:hypothetical protein